MTDIPPDDRQQVSSTRTASLPLIQQSKFPRDALYALLRAANQELDQTLGREHLIPDNDAYQVEVTVRTIAAPRPTASELQAQGYAVGAPEPGER